MVASQLKKIVQTEGDVAARVAVRFDEVTESTRLMQRILSRLPTGPHQVAISYPTKVLWASE